MKRLLLPFFLLISSFSSFAQMSVQYFDGADTFSTSLIVDTTVDTGHVWQIGKPQKLIFNSAATVPNAIVTDTTHAHKVNTTSSFIVSSHPTHYSSRRHVLAIRWKQKIDFNSKHSGGIIDYSIDSGKTWENAFNNPSIYSLYGFDYLNKDTLLSGEYAFSGTDTLWRDIWLCFPSFITDTTDSLLVRFTLKADTVDSNKEGWLIDNFQMHPTYAHTASKILKSLDSISVYPTFTTGEVHIDNNAIKRSNTIKKMQLVNVAGKMIREYSRFEAEVGLIDIGLYPPGAYYLKIITDDKSTVHNLVLKR